MDITIQPKEVYGEVKFYPVCDKAKQFAALANTKTLTPDTLRRIEALGFTIQTQHANTWGA